MYFCDNLGGLPPTIDKSIPIVIWGLDTPASEL
jgi:hypothetical protein